MRSGADAKRATLEEDCNYWRSPGKGKGKKTTAQSQSCKRNNIRAQHKSHKGSELYSSLRFRSYLKGFFQEKVKGLVERQMRGLV